jgi:hypothetical protein
MSSSYDIVFSFDTTGSMSQCIKEVKRKVKEVVSRLFKEIPGIRIGIVAHGDYCDKDKTYLMKHIDLGTDSQKIIQFIESVTDTNGGDTPEAYEYVLREIQKFSWNSDSMRALVMIGDAYPHEKDDNPEKIDWKEQVEEIKKMGINIYSVQALHYGNGKSYTFYKQMSLLTNGYHLMLDQFNMMNDMMLAICYHQLGSESLEKYEQEVKAREYGMTNGMRKMFDTMLKRSSSSKDEVEEVRDEEWDEEWDEDGDVEDEPRHPRRTRTSRRTTSAAVTEPVTEPVTEADYDLLRACPPAKYQILAVDEDCSIKNFVEGRGLSFKAGKGFYEFTKAEMIGAKKEVVLMKKDTGELFEGEVARKIIGLGDVDKKCKPSDSRDYRVFIQSTSYNRKLVGGTGFLYEAEEFGRE